MKPFSKKHITESLLLGFDLARILATGETISTATFAIRVETGTDPAVAGMLSGASQISGAEVAQRIINGVAGVSYILSATCATSAGNTYVESGRLIVENRA
jgi:hypothetical protein